MLDTTLADEPQGSEDLTVEEKERMARLILRLRSQVSLRRVRDLSCELPPASGEFNA